jgi:hypothetical protein
MFLLLAHSPELDLCNLHAVCVFVYPLINF